MNSNSLLRIMLNVETYNPSSPATFIKSRLSKLVAKMHYGSTAAFSCNVVRTAESSAANRKVSHSSTTVPMGSGLGTKFTARVDKNLCAHNAG